MTVLARLIEDLSKRQEYLRADRNMYTHALKDVSADDLINIAFSYVLKGLERSATIVEVVVPMGYKIRQRLKLPPDSVANAQVGWFVLISFFECKLLSFRKKHKYKNGKIAKHQSYALTIKDWKAIKELWTLIDFTKSDLFPLKKPPENWGSGVHDNGTTIIKKANPETIRMFNENNEDFTYLYDNLNRLQRVGWSINKDVFSVYQSALHLTEGPSPFKLHREIDLTKKKSLIIEAEAIERLALNNLNNLFYHLYNYDFRGRIYPNTAFLHEQSSDNAKGLLLIGNGVPLGDYGFYWLKVHTSNSWGNDKVSLDDRADFVNENLVKFISFANFPFVNKEWMDADKPFSFLACCFELRNLAEWLSKGNDILSYVSHLPIYIDGSNNGLQHLVAMAKDDTIAHLVNLVPQELPGDAYMYVANSVWDELENLKSQLSKEEIDRFEEIFTTANSLHKAYQAAPAKSEEKANAFKEVQEWRNKNRNIREKLFSVYWCKITDKKDRRKIMKRNTMTLAYGGTPYGFGQQIIEDTRDMSEYLRDKEHLWGAMLGSLAHKTCYEKLPGPSGMLRMFESIADRVSEQNKFLSWFSPVTNFPVVHGYKKPIDKRTKLKYGDTELKVVVLAWEESIVDKAAQRTGAAPNAVHSLDAVHLGMVVHDADFTPTIVHDSFGCHAGDMEKLFKLVREKFVELYKQEPLIYILTQLESLDLMPATGKLDVSSVLESDYAFC